MLLHTYVPFAHYHVTICNFSKPNSTNNTMTLIYPTFNLSPAILDCFIIPRNKPCGNITGGTTEIPISYFTYPCFLSDIACGMLCVSLKMPTAVMLLGCICTRSILSCFVAACTHCPIPCPCSGTLRRFGIATDRKR